MTVERQPIYSHAEAKRRKVALRAHHAYVRKRNRRIHVMLILAIVAVLVAEDGKLTDWAFVALALAVEKWS